MDKEVSKALFRERNIPTPPSLVCPDGEALSADRESPAWKLLEVSGRLVVKPAGCGSTVGVSIVDDGEELIRAVEAARKFDRKVIVESYIAGRELTVTVLDEKGRLEALPVVEIVPPEGFYTYEAKYTPGTSCYVSPAPLTPQEKDAVITASLAAHRALGCQVYSRVDLRLDDEGRPFVLEVNTAPGMTETSLVPKAAQAAGLSFPQLLARIVRASQERV
jgi:D-alanine-D-alanine ligase